MIIKYSNGDLVTRTQALDIPEGYKSILLLGKAATNTKAGEIIKPKSVDDFIQIFDNNSDLYDAYQQSYSLGVRNLFVVNCFNDSDYLRIFDQLIHYNFTYIVPINLFLSDMFYDPLIGEKRYYADFFIQTLFSVESLTTIIMTERHANLYADIDDFIYSMSDMVTNYRDHYSENRKPILLNECGNNLIFTLNNLEDIEHANIILASQLCLSHISEYPTGIFKNVTFDIDSIDMVNTDMSYYKYNDLSGVTNIDNLVNMRYSKDIYKNVLIDEVIKEIVRQMNLDEFKGKFYNIYVKMQIESRINFICNKLKGSIYKDYEVKNVGFINLDETSGYIYVELSIIPYGTLESVSIVLGV